MLYCALGIAVFTYQVYRTFQLNQYVPCYLNVSATWVYPITHSRGWRGWRRIDDGNRIRSWDFSTEDSAEKVIAFYLEERNRVGWQVNENDTHQAGKVILDNVVLEKGALRLEISAIEVEKRTTITYDLQRR
jgi:hypothetical protein